VQSGKRFLASPILVDIDEDGTEEVLVASKTAELMFFTCVPIPRRRLASGVTCG
jgi:hypothetical protein